MARTIGLYADDVGGALLALRTAARAARQVVFCRQNVQFDGVERCDAVIVQDAPHIRDAYVAAGIPVVLYLSNDPEAAIAAAQETFHAGRSDEVHVVAPGDGEPAGDGPAQGVQRDDHAGPAGGPGDGRDVPEGREAVTTPRPRPSRRR